MFRRWEPGVPDVVFGLVLSAVLYGGGYALLGDPGTLWHLRLGREIVATGHVPRVDTLTYTRGQAEWVDQSWLFDVMLAVVVDHAGWSTAVALSTLLLAAVYGALASQLLSESGRPVLVFLVAMLAAGAGALHFLVRPHLFTIAFFLLRPCIFAACSMDAAAGGSSGCCRSWRSGRTCTVGFLPALWS